MIKQSFNDIYKNCQLKMIEIMKSGMVYIKQRIDLQKNSQ